MDNWLRLSEVASMAGGELVGDDLYISGVSTDSRKLNLGDLFVALEGEKYDGHAFIDESIKQIVRGTLIHKPVKTKLPTVRVDDTLKGLSRWASQWRQHVKPKLVAITGSNGKTTVKQMIASILSQAASVCATRGNLNNHIGVPLTLLRMRKQDRFAVIEMGANHAGEIHHLSMLAQPDIALITNAGPAHLEGFGSIEGVAHAKGEIMDGLNTNGTIVLNADDDYLGVWLKKAKQLNVLTFGFGEQADVRGEKVSSHELSVVIAQDEFLVSLPTMGQHNMYNALAAVAATRALDIDIEVIQSGLNNAHLAAGRLQLKKGIMGITIIDDTYNANPASLRVAIEVLCSLEAEPWLVLGDMGELGEDAKAIHAQMGQVARQAGVKKLFGLGELTEHTVAAFGAGGMHFSKHEDLGKSLLSQVNANCCILVKGSRAMHMEDIVNVFAETEVMH